MTTGNYAEVASWLSELNDENELQKWLEEVIESGGWTVLREIQPHYSDYKADLVCLHDEYPPIGVECKFLRDKNYGIPLSHACQQITQQYRGRKYLGRTVDLWVVCPYCDFSDNEPDGRFREFFCGYGIGWLSINTRWLEADFAFSDVQKKIPLAGVGREIPRQRRENTDAEAIQNTVEKKMERFG